MRIVVELILIVVGLFLAFGTITSVTTFGSLCCLVPTFVVSALHLALVGAHGIAIYYLLIYVGAVLVIFLFLLMVTDFVDELGYESTKSFVYVAFICVFVLALLAQMLHVELGATFNEFMDSAKDKEELEKEAARIKNILGTHDYNVYVFSKRLYKEYGLVIINAGILLLIAMIGCIRVCLQDAIRLYRKSYNSDIQKQQGKGSTSIVKKEEDKK